MTPRALLPVLLVSILVARADAPAIDPLRDVAHFGDPDRILFWSPAEKVAGFRNMAALYPTRVIPAGDTPYPLPRAETDLGGFEFAHQGRTLSVDDYVREKNVVGLLVLHKGRIVYERYELGNSESTLWVSFSVAKSVTSLLLGAAVKDGYIAHLDEPVTRYLPRLRGSAYDAVAIRDLLQMASGVAWDEDYADPASDINTVQWATLALYDALREKPRVAEAGQRFNYNTAETNLVGNLVRSAIGNNLSTYLSEKIWKPFGMEFDGNWALTEPGGGEFGGSSISATLRDYGRLGQFVLEDGRLRDGTRVLPEGWVAESTAPSEVNEHYGYQWWLRSGGAFGASGIFGQGIHVEPGRGVVIALQSAREIASDDADWALQLAMFAALARHVGGGAE